MRTVAGGDTMFLESMNKRCGHFLALLAFVNSRQSWQSFMVRPFLADLHSQAAQLEEFLDASNARNNTLWRPFRTMTAAVKRFSDIAYELLHIHNCLPDYKLLVVDANYEKDTQDAIIFTADVISHTASQMLDLASRIGLHQFDSEIADKDYDEHIPPHRLSEDVLRRQTDTVIKTITMLSTTFLNLASESTILHEAANIPPHEYCSYVPQHITEENMRNLELKFHNLQSLYDTYVLETENEQLDDDLPVFRAHITVVLHLLKTATSFTHYYERHQHCAAKDISEIAESLVRPQQLLSILMNYSVRYSSLYINGAEYLCKNMLKRYTEISQIEVPVPSYRGFHVRPATLISKLVFHYGSDVKLDIDGQSYDASSPLEIFRANEKINAQKRKWLINEIIRLKLLPSRLCNTTFSEVIKNVITTMAEQKKIILYENPLQIPEHIEQKDGTIIEKVAEEIARLQAMGKIDIETELRVSFTGDKRVLDDIRLLAESGYGEDNLGNNITLPKELFYLR